MQIIKHIMFLTLVLVVSSKSYANICQRHPAIVAIVENQIFKKCQDISESDLGEIKYIHSLDSTGRSYTAADFAGLINLVKLDFNYPIYSFELTPNVFSPLIKLQTLSVTFKDTSRATLDDSVFLGLENLEDLGIGLSPRIEYNIAQLELNLPALFRDLKSLKNLSIYSGKTFSETRSAFIFLNGELGTSLPRPELLRKLSLNNVYFKQQPQFSNLAQLRCMSIVISVQPAANPFMNFYYNVPTAMTVPSSDLIKVFIGQDSMPSYKQDLNNLFDVAQWTQKFGASLLTDDNYNPNNDCSDLP